MTAPISSPTCGVPPAVSTAAGWSNSTRTSIVSPARKEPPGPRPLRGTPTPMIRGGPPSPSTTVPGSFVTAYPARLGFTGTPPPVIEPPAGSSAEAPMLTPSASRSSTRTV